VTSADGGYVALFAKIERDRGFQGALYRQRCLRRRVAVRMRARGIESPEAYAALLDQDPSEYERLLRVLTINVSRFFRNPEVWDAIRDRLLPELLASRGLKAWSAGSAGGEEAYSLAILVHEWLNERGRSSWWGDIRIIGTDIDGEAVEAARDASYTEVALTETPSEVRERWFTPGPPFRLKLPVTSRVEFHQLDLLSDRPDFEVDLILCRNLLIYLDREAQSRVFQTFVDTLRPGGYLVLGRVETLAPEARDRFDVVDGRERVYRKR
jgi:chemotaxis methyl-accepting protein methylase